MDFLWCFLSRHTIPHMKGVTSSCLALSSPLHSSISITARSCPHSSPQTLVTHETNDKKAGRRNKGERERERAQPNIRHNQWKGSMYEKKKREEFNYDIFSRASQLWTASLATPRSLQWIEK